MSDKTDNKTAEQHLAAMMHHFMPHKVSMMMFMITSGSLSKDGLAQRFGFHRAGITAIGMQLNKLRLLAEARGDQDILAILDESVEVEISTYM